MYLKIYEEETISLKDLSHESDKYSPKLLIPSDKSLFRTQTASVYYLTRFISIYSINSLVPSTVLFCYLCLYLYVNVGREKKRKKVKTWFLDKHSIIVAYKLFE